MKNKTIVIWLQGFNAVTAILGGMALIAGTIALPFSYLEHTAFNNFYWPGVILLCIVGGSALLAVFALYKRLATAHMISLLAATIMLFWIICEIASIREFSVLQLIYLVTSIAIIYKTPRK